MPERADRWASTMAGHGTAGARIRLAHADSHAVARATVAIDRAAREEPRQELAAVRGATRAVGAGDRARAEEPDEWRTCFERDRDRILHAPAFRRLAGKTQVFVFPDDHQRTRLTHALEVAQVATSVARALGLNVALTEAIALGHDCGHGPGGHASEDALVAVRRRRLRPRRVGRRRHAGPAQPVRRDARRHPQPLVEPARARPRRRARSCRGPTASPTCATTSRTPSPPASSPPTCCPPVVADRCGASRSRQLGAFIGAMVDAAAETGRIGMTEPVADALAEFRRFNYEHVYLRPASRAQADAVIALLRALVEHYADRPHLLPDPPARRRRHRRRGARRGRLRRRDDRPLRLPPGRGAARLGSGQAPPASADAPSPAASHVWSFPPDAGWHESAQMGRQRTRKPTGLRPLRGDVDAGDVGRGGRCGTTPPSRRRRLRSLEHGLDRAVDAVGDPAGDVARVGLAAARVAEPHPLHVAGDTDDADTCRIGAQASTGLTSTTLRPLRSPNLTLPSTSENSVSSPPMPTFLPGWNLVPRWRTMIVPAVICGAVEHLHAQALGVGVTAVAGGAATLGLRHGSSSYCRSAVILVISTTV